MDVLKNNRRWAHRDDNEGNETKVPLALVVLRFPGVPSEPHTIPSTVSRPGDTFRDKVMIVVKVMFCFLPTPPLAAGSQIVVNHICRYVRINTIPPESIRYGRSTAAPLASIATAKHLGSCSPQWDANIGGSLGKNGLHKDFAPRTTTTKQCRRLMQGGWKGAHPQRRREGDDPAIDGIVQEDADGSFVGYFEARNNTRAGAGTEGWAPPDNGSPLPWSEMEPQKEKNASLMMQGGKDAAGIERSPIAEAVSRDITC